MSVCGNPAARLISLMGDSRCVACGARGRVAVADRLRWWELRLKMIGWRRRYLTDDGHSWVAGQELSDRCVPEASPWFGRPARGAGLPWSVAEGGDEFVQGGGCSYEFLCGGAGGLGAGAGLFGGYGDCGLRDRGAIDRDVAEGYVSAAGTAANSSTRD